MLKIGYRSETLRKFMPEYERAYTGLLYYNFHTNIYKKAFFLLKVGFFYVFIYKSLSLHFKKHRNAPKTQNSFSKKIKPNLYRLL